MVDMPWFKIHVADAELILELLRTSRSFLDQQAVHSRGKLRSAIENMEAESDRVSPIY